MSVEIKVPALGESITEATVAQWFKTAGDAVNADEPLVELETDKVTLEVPAPAGGTLSEIRVDQGENVEIGAVLGLIDEGAAGKPAAAPAAEAPAPAPQAPAPAEKSAAAAPMSPAVRKLVDENALEPAQIAATGKGGRLTKGDVLKVIEGGQAAAPAAPQPTAAPAPAPIPAPSGPRPDAEREQRVRMTRLRKRIAERLKEAQNTAAILTTFNEVDMTNVMALR
ncbi:MAG: biotin/lipoyl-containing protein, partial [Alphaproteobacteria bacterium]